MPPSRVSPGIETPWSRQTTVRVQGTAGPYKTSLLSSSLRRTTTASATRREFRFRGWHKDASVPCKDGFLGALPSTSTTQHDPRRKTRSDARPGILPVEILLRVPLLIPRSYRLVGPGRHSFKVETGDRSPVGVPSNVEVAEAASWAVTPTQRFESAPHPEGMAEKLCGGLQPRRHRCESCCPLHSTAAAQRVSTRQAASACKAVICAVAGYLGVTQPGQSSCLGRRVPLVRIQPSRPIQKAPWLVRKSVRLIRGRQVVRLHPARPRFGC